MPNIFKLNLKSNDALAHELATALRKRHGSEASAICRVALRNPDLKGKQRRITRQAMHLIDGALVAVLAEPTRVVTRPVAIAPQYRAA